MKTMSIADCPFTSDHSAVLNDWVPSPVNNSTPKDLK
ncbi:hypothetical protein NPIL_432761, partial [Nephila pilipes]